MNFANIIRLNAILKRLEVQLAPFVEHRLVNYKSGPKGANYSDVEAATRLVQAETRAVLSRLKTFADTNSFDEIDNAQLGHVLQDHKESIKPYELAWQICPYCPEDLEITEDEAFELGVESPSTSETLIEMGYRLHLLDGVGGSEGDGEYCSRTILVHVASLGVLKVPQAARDQVEFLSKILNKNLGKIFKIEGTYYSYDGSNYDEENIQEVKPTIVEVVEYE